MELGILHPGTMGATVAAAARAQAHVLFASEGRSAATLERAHQAGLSDAGTLDALVARAEVIVSVCPPAAALELAQQVAARGYRGLYVDANAISPATVRRIAEVLARSGAPLIDGGIIGPPARQRGTTRMYLSGPRAQELADCFAQGPLEAIAIDGPVGAASALKMVFAAWTKGSAALLAAIHAVASDAGVEAELLREWQESQPELPGRLRAGAAAIAPKAWRFVGEMHEIADTFADAGLPDGFFRAAAEVYQRLAELKDAGEPTSPETVARLLRKLA